MSRVRSGRWLGLLMVVLASSPAAAQTYTWNTTTTDNAWLNPANWTGGTAGTWPGFTATPNGANGTQEDTAVIGTFAFPAANGLGINLDTAGGNFTLGAIQFTSSSGDLQIGSSSGSGFMILNSATVNGVGNVILANTSTTNDLTLAPGAPGVSGSFMGIQLGNANSTMLVNSGRTLTVNNVISGAFSGGVSVPSTIGIQGGGTVVFGNAGNAFTGAVAVTGGSTLSVSADGNFGQKVASSQVVLNDGTLLASGTFTLDSSRPIVIGSPTTAGGTGTISVASGQTLTYGGVIQNAGSQAEQLNKTGSGTLILSGANTYTGGTLITDGTVRVDNVGALGTAGIASLKPTGTTGASLLLNAAGTLARTVTVGVPNDTGTGTILVGTDPSLSGSATFGGQLQVRRPVTLQAGATGSTTFSGLIVSSGSTPADITISAPTAATTGAHKVVFTQNSTANTYGNITIGDTAGPNAALQLGVGTASNNNIVPDSSNISFFQAPAGGNAGSLLILAPGTAATGETIGALNSLAPGAGTITTITGSSAYTLTVGGGNQSGAYSGTIGEGAGKATVAIVKTGSGTQVFSGSNTYSAGTTITGGTLMVNGQTGTQSGTGTGAVTVNTGATLAGNGQAAGAVTVNTGGRITGGQGTAVNEQLALGNNLTLANNTTIRIAASNGATANDTTLAGSSQLAVAGVLGKSATGDRITIDIAFATGGNLDLTGGTTYTRRVATYGSLSNLTPGSYTAADGIFNVTSPSFGVDPGWTVLVGQNGSALDVVFTPVPEPGAILAIGLAGLGLAGLARRARRGGAATLS